MNPPGRTNLVAASLLASATFVGTPVAMTGCNRGDQDASTRPQWVHDLAVDGNMPLREALNGTWGYQFFDGWYPMEFDPKTGGAWRWMSRHGTVRLRVAAALAANPGASVLHLSIFGWSPQKELLGDRSSRMTVAINGHVLDSFDLEPEIRERRVAVPRELLVGEWVDMVLDVSNYGRPPMDWRDLAFATTGFLWQPESNRDQ